MNLNRTFVKKKHKLILAILNFLQYFYESKFNFAKKHKLPFKWQSTDTKEMYTYISKVDLKLKPNYDL